ncbi:glycosyltransferase [Candidatus Woesearchaeota archaeon]|nr:glycosyltransferase [Candidatus Woesearchaeota archaeon]
MRKIVFVTDIDLSKETGTGISLYMKNLLENINAEKIVVGKNKPDKNYFKAHRFVSIDAESNYKFLFELFCLDKSFIPDDAVIVFQRPDFCSAFLNVSNKKIITVHGNPAEIIKKKKGRATFLIYKILEKIGFFISDKIIFIDSDTKKKYGISSSVIPPGIDTDLFFAKKKKRSKIKTLLYVGRIEKEKNVDKIIKEFEGIVNKDYRLIVIGKGRQRIDSSDKRVRIISGVAHDRIPDFMNRADALVLMSDSEGVPTVILEALSSGTPVLARDVGDVSKLVVDGATGYITEFGEIEENFNKILEKKDWVKECVKKAKEYSWDKIAKRLEKAYFEK